MRGDDILQFIPTPPYMSSMYSSGIPTIGGGFSYYNPIYYQQQREAEEKERIKQFNQQVELWKRFCLASYNYEGIPVPESVQEDIDNMFSIDTFRETQNDLYEYNELVRIHQMAEQQKAYQESMQNQRIQQLQQANSEPSEPMSVYEWLSGPATDQYIKSLEDRCNDRSNVAKLYDNNAYNRLLGIHESSYNSLNKVVNIDDMEIGLPPEFKTAETIKRRENFIKSIMQTDKGW